MSDAYEKGIEAMIADAFTFCSRHEGDMRALAKVFLAALSADGAVIVAGGVAVGLSEAWQWMETSHMTPGLEKLVSAAIAVRR